MNNQVLKTVYDELLWRTVLIRGWATLIAHMCGPCNDYKDRMGPLVDEIDRLIDTVELLRK